MEHSFIRWYIIQLNKACCTRLDICGINYLKVCRFYFGKNTRTEAGTLTSVTCKMPVRNLSHSHPVNLESQKVLKVKLIYGFIQSFVHLKIKPAEKLRTEDIVK